MKLRINESEFKPRRTRRTKWDIIDELEKNGYMFLDSGYGDWHYYAKEYENDFIVKGFFDKSDTPGLKMYSLYGKLKDSSYEKWYKALYDFAKENYPDNWTPNNFDKFFSKYYFISSTGVSKYDIRKRLFVEVNDDLMNNEGFDSPPYYPEFYDTWKAYF